MSTPTIQPWQTDRSWGLVFLVAFPLWVSSILVGASAGVALSALHAPIGEQMTAHWVAVMVLHGLVLVGARLWGFKRHRRLWFEGEQVTATLTKVTIEEPEFDDSLRIHVEARLKEESFGRRVVSAYWTEGDVGTRLIWRERLQVGGEVVGWTDPGEPGEVAFSRADVVTLERRIAFVSALVWVLVAVGWWLDKA